MWKKKIIQYNTGLLDFIISCSILYTIYMVIAQIDFSVISLFAITCTYMRVARDKFNITSQAFVSDYVQSHKSTNDVHKIVYLHLLIFITFNHRHTSTQCRLKPSSPLQLHLYALVHFFFLIISAEYTIPQYIGVMRSILFLLDLFSIISSVSSKCYFSWRDCFLFSFTCEISR